MKSIIVTGATGGIGYETARYFCLNTDFQVFALGRNEQKLNALFQPHRFKNLKTIAIDFEKPFSSDNFSWLPEEVSILLNNAGMMLNKKFSDIYDEEWKKVYQVNFFSQVSLIRHVLPVMGKTGPAHIVNISSMGGFQGSVKFKGLSAYASSKAALANLTELLAVELEDTNIRVNCLALGAVNTEMLKNAFPGYEALLNADEMAKFIAEFALNGHKYFNGKILPVSLSTP
ncbi:MAG TPA: SDR family oxidoreductase [Bacteroidia bacterium]|nr:SDR family oxidoreductase [Bacteroidia bacterium]HRS59237.1 SDR family oxidoreductase [Bacteroidia bacterium]HRU68881.1 SDR family oxidoreductase [Bacteroidia bacterium]